MARLNPKQQAIYEMDQVCREYLAYFQKIQQSGPTQIGAITRVVKALGDYLQRSGVVLTDMNIEHVDEFLAIFHASYAKTTQRLYRSYLRCFLRYLYNERNLIKQNLADLLIGPPMFAKAKPPQFLRPCEVRQLFDRLPHSTSCELRTYAQVHLAYYLGLRPIEISRITLDDISFAKGLLNLRNRKNNRPLHLPIPEEALKAISAYIVGGRPKSHYRALFLIFWPDPTPMSAGLTGQYLIKSLREAGLPGTAYCFRHSFAINTLRSAIARKQSPRNVLPVLATYMGHVEYRHTMKYLRVVDAESRTRLLNFAGTRRDES